MYKKITLVIASILIGARALFAGTDALNLHGQSAVLMDAVGMRVLYAKNPRQIIPPASLTKLMTLHLAYEALARGQFTRNQIIEVNDAADFNNQPKGSSVMMLEKGQRVSFFTLMLGLAVPSGNDAAVAIAEVVSGSVPAFVVKMNEEAARLGLVDTRFVDPSGIDADNSTSAFDFARFSAFYVRRHPQSTRELHTVAKFDYPLPENWGTAFQRRTTSFPNRNLITTQYAGCDGLKTGFIDEAGYNLAATALRNDMRLIVVDLGVLAPGSTTGGLRRAADAAALFDYGFRTYQAVNPAKLYQKEVRNTLKVWGGAAPTTTVVIDPAAQIIVKKDEVATAVASAFYPRTALAPVSKGQTLGTLVYTTKSGRHNVPIIAAENVKKTWFWPYACARFTAWLSRASREID